MKRTIKDRALKEKILSVGLDKVYNKAKRRVFAAEECGEILDKDPVSEFRKNYGFEVWRVSRNLVKSQYGRYSRCKEKVGSMIICGTAWFLTLTFKDDLLNGTTQATRRRYVARTLKKISTCYVANIDFGDPIKNPNSHEREHYHAIVLSDEEPDLSAWKSHCGFVCVERIGNTAKDAKKVCKYTAKLSRHALKKSTASGEGEPPRLIYSRLTNGYPPFFLLDD